MIVYEPKHKCHRDNTIGMKIRSKITHFLTAWLLLSVVALLMYWILWFIIDSEEMSSKQIFIDALHCCSVTLLAMLLCGMLMSIFDKIMKSRKHIFMLMASLVAMNVCVVRVVATVLANIYGDDLPTVYDGMEEMFILSIIAIFFTVVIILDHHYNLLSADRERTRQLELAALKRQLDPHFMFNSLSSLDGLIEENIEQAHLYLSKLAQIYRYITSHVTGEVVTLRESIEFTKDYTSLMEIRHPGHFEIHVDAALGESDEMILPMSLQLLVENAVKHNCHSAKEPLVIRITKDGDYVSVRNTLRPNNIDKTSESIGLDNLRRRYLLTAHRDCIVVDNSPEFYEVKIPIIPAQAIKKWEKSNLPIAPKIFTL